MLKILDFKDWVDISDKQKIKPIIRQRYLELCLKYHPDKNINNQSYTIVEQNKFKQITEAYNYLMDKNYVATEKYTSDVVLIEAMVSDIKKVNLGLLPYLVRYYADIYKFAKFLFRNNYLLLFNEVRLIMKHIHTISINYYPLSIFHESGVPCFSHITTNGFKQSFPPEVERFEDIEFINSNNYELDIFLDRSSGLEDYLLNKRNFWDKQWHEPWYIECDIQRMVKNQDHDIYQQKRDLVYNKLTFEAKLGILHMYCIKIDSEELNVELEINLVNKINLILMNYKF